jgi:segregation and condensation protein B
METELEKEQALIEAILFLETEPLDSATIARVSGLSKEAVEKAVENLKERYSAEVHGIEIVQVGGGYIVSPKRELWEYLKERYGKKNDSKLSKAALETLSIIAYSQPITRGEIESLRGVAADTMIRLLLDRGLIKETGKKDAPGKPIQYGTTKDFLKFFRLNSIADLPKLDDIDKERFELNG